MKLADMHIRACIILAYINTLFQVMRSPIHKERFRLLSLQFQFVLHIFCPLMCAAPYSLQRGLKPG